MKDPEYVQAIQDLRRSNATVPIASGKKYKRKARSRKRDDRDAAGE